jgi:hypothetical protein
LTIHLPKCQNVGIDIVKNVLPLFVDKLLQLGYVGVARAGNHERDRIVFDKTPDITFGVVPSLVHGDGLMKKWFEAEVAVTPKESPGGGDADEGKKTAANWYTVLALYIFLSLLPRQLRDLMVPRPTYT